MSPRGNGAAPHGPKGQIGNTRMVLYGVLLVLAAAVPVAAWLYLYASAAGP